MSGWASEAAERRGVVLRWGELFLKGGNRRLFAATLARRAEQAIEDLTPRPDVVPGYGRVFVDGGADRAAIARLGRVFGVSSLSPVWFIRPEPDAVRSAAVVLAQRHLGPSTKTFRITAKRVDKHFPLTSQQMNAAVGEAVRLATGLKVDLENPDLEIGIEIAGPRSFLFVERIPGAGGLPVGTSGLGLLLLSGGIDSPVAGWLCQKRGLQLAAVHFHSHPYTDEGSRKKAEALAAILAWPQKTLGLWVVPFGRVQEHLRECAPGDLLVVLYRRSMIRIAEALAVREKAGCLVTGESLGQVASQTLENLTAIQAVASLPVLRPLIAYDKAETIRLAQRIGTFDISILPHDDCCSLFVPSHPCIRAKEKVVARAELRADFHGLEEEVLAAAERMEIAGRFVDP